MHFLAQIRIWAATWQNQQSECVSNEDSDQPGHLPSLIRVFSVHMLGAHSLSWFYHVVAHFGSTTLNQSKIQQTLTHLSLAFNPTDFGKAWKNPGKTPQNMATDQVLLLYYSLQDYLKIIKPSHNKTSKMTLAANEDIDQLVHLLSLIRVLAVRLKKAQAP